MKAVSLSPIDSGVEKIGERLVPIGLGDWSVRLRQAVCGGATFGEILMAVRWNLKELKAQKRALPQDLQDAMGEVIQLIDQSGV